MTFRYYAYEAYKEITKILKLNKKEIDSFSISLTDQEKQQIVGTYQYGELTLMIVIKNNKIYYISESYGEVELFFINKTFFTLNSLYIGHFRTFNLDENKNVIGFTARVGNIKAEFKKIN